MSVGDLVDRWSIAMLKHYRANEDNHLEVWAYQDALKKNDSAVIKKYFDLLSKVNGDIWNLESDIRKGKETELGLEEVGRRAIEIRNLNSIRIELKNELNQLTGSGFVEKKYNHASE